MACGNLSINKKNCTCRDTTCERHGVCCECIKYHRENGGKPSCLK